MTFLSVDSDSNQMSLVLANDWVCWRGEGSR